MGAEKNLEKSETEGEGKKFEKIPSDLLNVRKSGASLRRNYPSLKEVKFLEWRCVR